MNEIIKQPHSITLSPLSIKHLLDSFIEDQDLKKSSEQLYRRTLRQYFNWVEKKGYLLNEIARPQIKEYKDELLNSGMSSLTVSSYITSVKNFYKWTEANKYYPNIAKGIKAVKRRKQFRKQPLAPEQASAFLSYYDNKTLRDRAIANLLIRTGLRTVEVIRANVEDIVYKGSQRVLLVQGKGMDDKENFVILTDKTYKPIADYLAARGTVKASEPLFTSISNNSKGNRLTTRTISYIAKEGLKAIGLDHRNFTAHSLRHTTAVNILRAGGSLETAQFTLRHSNPATTQIYIATLDEERRLQNSGEALLDSIY